MSLSNNNLDYDIDNVQKIERICNTNNVCNGGITRTYSVTIKYKNGATTTNSDIEFIATFNFKNYYTITYSGFDSTTGLPTGILQDDTKTITFNTTTGMPSNVTVTGATGTYTNPATTNTNPATTNPDTATLALTAVTGNVTITGATGNVNVVTNPDGSTTTTTENTVDNGDGTETTTTIVVNKDSNGNQTSSSQTTSTTGTSGGVTTTTSNTTYYDASGNETGTSETQTVANSNGSSQTTTTNYDTNGNAVSGSTNTVDTSGNSNTQEVEYNSQGNAVVTSYTIDTTNNSNGGETINDSLETGFIPFDGSTDWDLYMKYNFSSNENWNSSGSSSQIVCALSCLDFSSGSFTGGFALRYQIRTEVATSAQGGQHRYRTMIPIENNGSSQTKYLYNTNGTGVILTSPVTWELIVQKRNTTITFKLKNLQQIYYHETKNQTTSVSTAAANTEKSVSWTETTTGSKVDITIGGYLASDKTVKQKAKMEVLDFYVRKVST